MVRDAALKRSKASGDDASMMPSFRRIATKPCPGAGYLDRLLQLRQQA
jgi:hypothetical protein